LAVWSVRGGAAKINSRGAAAIVQTIDHEVSRLGLRIHPMNKSGYFFRGFAQLSVTPRSSALAQNRLPADRVRLPTRALEIFLSVSSVGFWFLPTSILIIVLLAVCVRKNSN